MLARKLNLKRYPFAIRMGDESICYPLGSIRSASRDLDVGLITQCTRCFHYINFETSVGITFGFWKRAKIARVMSKEAETAYRSFWYCWPV